MFTIVHIQILLYCIIKLVKSSIDTCMSDYSTFYLIRATTRSHIMFLTNLAGSRLHSAALQTQVYVLVMYNIKI